MGKRKVLDGRDGETIAKKLKASVRAGRKHDVVTVRVDGVHVGQFNIRHDVDTSHNYIPRQIGIKSRDGVLIAKCTLDLTDYRRLIGMPEKPEPPYTAH